MANPCPLTLSASPSLSSRALLFPALPLFPATFSEKARHLPTSLSLSLSSSKQPSRDHHALATNNYTRRLKWLRRWWNVRGQLGGGSDVICEFTTADHCPPSSLAMTLGAKMLIRPLFQNGTLRSWQKCMDHQHVFLCKNGKLCKWIWPNRVLFWVDNIEFILVSKNAFQQYIICLSLKSFAKKIMFFETICEIDKKFAPFCL